MFTAYPLRSPCHRGCLFPCAVIVHDNTPPYVSWSVVPCRNHLMTFVTIFHTARGMGWTTVSDTRQISRTDQLKSWKVPKMPGCNASHDIRRCHESRDVQYSVSERADRTTGGHSANRYQMAEEQERDHEVKQKRHIERLRRSNQLRTSASSFIRRLRGSSVYISALLLLSIWPMPWFRRRNSHLHSPRRIALTDYFRAINWILSSRSGKASTVIVISPYEVSALLPICPSSHVLYAFLLQPHSFRHPDSPGPAQSESWPATCVNTKGAEFIRRAALLRQ